MIPIYSPSPGSVFISPSLTRFNPDNMIDVLSVEVEMSAGETYQMHDHEDSRPFLVGPPGTAPDVMPPDIYKDNLVGTMFDSVTMVTTVIFY